MYPAMVMAIMVELAHQQFGELRREIDAVRSQVGNTYTLGDEIKHLQHDMDQLRVK